MNKKWKADEMEMTVNFKAMRLSWIFSGLALLVWCIVELITDGKLPFIAFSILMLQNIIYLSAKLWITHKLTDKENEE